MKRTFTFWLTAAGALLCLFHFLGFDPNNLILFALSVPLWIMSIFTDFRDIPIAVAYLLTTLSWGLIGYIIDRLSYRRRAYQ